MAKLELALLVGADSKEFLAQLTDVVERLEALKLDGSIDRKAQAEEIDEDQDEDFTPKTKAAKKAVKDFDEDEDLEAASSDETEDDFTDKKTTKKAKKLTVDDVNDACKARAAQTGGKEGRNEVLAILKKKFKTTSVSELKPEQYAAAISAMA